MINIPKVMSIFNQDLDQINGETLIGKGSPFYKRVLAEGGAGYQITKATYDYSTLTLITRDPDTISTLSLNEDDDFFRNYLPTPARICTPRTRIHVYQPLLSGDNTEVFCYGFVFYGDELQNLSISTGKTTDNGGVNLACKYINNVKIETTSMSFGRPQIESNYNSHPLGLPKFGDNVYISPDCKVQIDTDLAGTNRIRWWKCLDLLKLDYQDDVINTIRTRTTYDLNRVNVLPMHKDTRIGNILNLPNQLRGLASYTILFHKEYVLKIVSFFRADQLPQDNLNEVFRPCQAKPNSSAYISEDGYAIIM